MVPENPLEGAVLSAPDTTAEGNPEAEADVAESIEASVEGSTGLSWADLSEGATAPTAGISGEGGAASGAPGDISDSEDLPRFDALSLLDPVETEEPQVSAEDIFDKLAAEPTSDLPIEPEASLEEATGNPEIDNIQTPQEVAENSIAAESDPIVGSSSTIDPKEEADPIEAEPSATSDLPDSATVFAPVYVEYPGGGEEEDSVPPPPTSPFLEAEGAATGASASGHVPTGHSPSAPSRPARVRGTKGGRKEQTKRLIKRWQTDFDRLADFLWEEAGFWRKYVHHSDADALAELIWTVRVFRVLVNHCTDNNQILVHFANTFAPYRNWVFFNGYRQRDGLSAAPDLVAILFYLIGITLTCKLLDRLIRLAPFGTTTILIGALKRKLRLKQRVVFSPKILSHPLQKRIIQL